MEIVEPQPGLALDRWIVKERLPDPAAVADRTCDCERFPRGRQGRISHVVEKGTARKQRGPVPWISGTVI